MYNFKFISDHIKDYDVIIAGDAVTVYDVWKVVTKQQVNGLGAFVRRSKDFKLGWAMLPDCEVIYLYDKADNNYGYAVNLQFPSCSEWGYAPFS